MKEVVCPNCKEKFKLVLDKKYVDCPFCREEFKIGEESLLGRTGSKEDGRSLLDKLKGSSAG